MSRPDQLVSGEGVAYELSRAGLGSRTIAALIDLALQLIALLILLVIDGLSAGNSDSDAIGALSIVEVVLVLAGYPILWEWLTRGRTVGKLAMGLRVVRDDGGPIGFRHALVRGLSSFILEKPGLIFPIGTAAGAITLAAGSSDKRIGDLLAGTFVVNERGGPARSAQPMQFLIAPELAGWAAIADLSRVDDGLALSIRQFLTRSWEMTPGAQYALAEQLRVELAQRITPPPPAVPTHWLLNAVLGERRRRVQPGGGPAGLTAPPQGW